MTDNEIIEALKRCPQHTECCYCNSLEECGNKRILTTSVFDLINRQKAEVEQLKIVASGLEQALKNVTAEVDRLLKECKSKEEAYNKEFCLRKELKAEIERLSIESETLVTQLKVAYEQIHKLNMAKSEAIKEFEDK